VRIELWSMVTIALKRALGALPPGARMRLKRVVRRPRWGNLRRHTPFSTNYGFDRGTPADRYYIERFLAAHARDIRGHVLEVREASYTHRFGGARVTRSDVLDIDPGNLAATIVGDLGNPATLPAHRFDAVVLTQTLQYARDVRQALGNIWASLRPGGVLLLSVPVLVRLDHAPESDLHRFTPAGFKKSLREALPAADLEVRGHGNLLGAAALLYGIACEELPADALADDDPIFPVVVTARAAKPSSGGCDS
jgi:SAM-dependent methyltransferase